MLSFNESVWNQQIVLEFAPCQDLQKKIVRRNSRTDSSIQINKKNLNFLHVTFTKKIVNFFEIDKTDFCPKNQHMRWLKSTIQKEKKNGPPVPLSTKSSKKIKILSKIDFQKKLQKFLKSTKLVPSFLNFCPIF